MSRRGFWLGVLVGAIITGLLLAAAMFVIVRFRWPAASIYGLRGHQFGVNPRGWFYPRLPSRSLGRVALLCGPLLLLAGAVVLGLLLGRYWRRTGQNPVQSGGQPPAVESTVKPVDEAPVETGSSEAKPELPAETGENAAKS